MHEISCDSLLRHVGLIRRAAASLRAGEAVHFGIGSGDDPTVRADTSGLPVESGASPSPAESARQRVAVAMPARNAAPFIAEAIASVLLQRDVDVRLVVVDDASTDGTADLVARMTDPRITLLRNPRRRGIGFCHNAAVAASDAPVICHVDADDLILPGALVATTSALLAHPRAGQAYCDYIQVDAGARTTPSAFLRQAAFVRRHRDGISDMRRHLIVHGMVAGPLRTYRREALDEAGPFDERLPWAVDYEMTLRIAARRVLVRVPEILYCQRVHSANTQEHLRLRALRFWWSRVTICRRLRSNHPGSVLGFSDITLAGLLLASLVHSLELPRLGKRVLPSPLRRRLISAARKVSTLRNT
jgi:glycosyltransferase involved in cell wall biosynthesis